MEKARAKEDFSYLIVTNGCVSDLRLEKLASVAVLLLLVVDKQIAVRKSEKSRENKQTETDEDFGFFRNEFLIKLERVVDVIEAIDCHKERDEHRVDVKRHLLLE